MHGHARTSAPSENALIDEFVRLNALAQARLFGARRKGANVGEREHLVGGIACVQRMMMKRR